MAEQLRQLRLTALSAALIGLVVLGYGGWRTYEGSKYLSTLGQATATVGNAAGKSGASRNTAPVEMLAATYTDAAGKVATGRIGANEGYKTGDKVLVYYDPANPDFVMLPKYADLYRAPFLVWIVGGLMVALGLGGFGFASFKLRELQKA